jgi:hypothetical protein
MTNYLDVREITHKKEFVVRTLVLKLGLKSSVRDATRPLQTNIFI